jgi:hypothetical protein
LLGSTSDHILELHLGEWIDEIDEEFLKKYSINHKNISLHLNNINDIRSDQILALQLYISPKLIEIEVKNCNNLPWKKVKNILEKANFIESFIFIKNSWLNDSVIEFIANKFTKTFKVLLLENSLKITDQSLYQIGRKCFNVKSISLRCCPNITDLGLGMYSVIISSVSYLP